MNPDELLAIGQQLRAVRQERGYSLDEVSTATKIRAKFLEAIELGEPDASLSEMQLRGFLRNYAAFLRLDVDAMLAGYRQAVQDNKKKSSGIFKFKQPEAPPPEVPVIPIKPHATIKTPPHTTPAVRSQTQPIPVVEGENSRGGMVMGIVIGGLLVLAGVFVAYLLVVAVNEPTTTVTENSPPPLVLEGDSTQETPTRPPDPKGTVEILYTATPNATPTTSGIIVNAPNQPDMTGADSIAIAVSASQRSWVKVTVDGQVQYEGILRPGTALNYQGRETITLRTSNAGGIEVVVNNQNLGSLGGRGELFEQTFSLDVLNLPTAVVPTATLPDAITPESIAPTATTEAAPAQPTVDTSAQVPTNAPPADLNLPTPLPAPPILATNVPVENPTTTP